MARFSFVVTAIVHINHINPVRCCLLGSVLDHIIFFAATINKFKSARLLSDVASLIGLWGGEFVVARIMASIAVFVVEHRPMWHRKWNLYFPLSSPFWRSCHHGYRKTGDRVVTSGSVEFTAHKAGAPWPPAYICTKY
jgi:hypothetical protein